MDSYVMKAINCFMKAEEDEKAARAARKAALNAKWVQYSYLMFMFV